MGIFPYYTNIGANMFSKNRDQQITIIVRIMHSRSYSLKVSGDWNS